MQRGYVKQDLKSFGVKMTYKQHEYTFNESDILQILPL